jgi:hypothetical protein
MRVTQLVPGRYLEALDCGDSVGDTIAVTIDRVAIEHVGQEQQPKGIVYFRELDRPMILNRTNAKAISGLFGGETDDWTGKTIRLVRSETTYAGRPCACIRISEAPASKRSK